MTTENIFQITGNQLICNVCLCSLLISFTYNKDLTQIVIPCGTNSTSMIAVSIFSHNFRKSILFTYKTGLASGEIILTNQHNLRYETTELQL